jgi:UDP-N-acetylglucosamine 2-epimerase (non-hydrolysing)
MMSGVGRARHVLSIVGARPNFMKTAPVIAALKRRTDQVRHTLVHTGQHYDDTMSRIFLEELGVHAPDVMLSVGSASHAVQTARVMERIEPVMTEIEPDLVLVPGDVNSTLAAALVASKLGIRVGHIEAGLRSFDRTMPEEINRVLTDQISDLLFIHSPEARENLVSEGVSPERVHAVGNTMIDTLVAMRSRIADAKAALHHGLDPGSYLVVTLHRPALVDGPLLAAAVAALDEVAESMLVVFPIHPRTAASMERQGLSFASPGMRVLEPLGYIEFLSLVQNSRAVLTDSGGMQEETTYLGIPCFTLRDNTERPITCDLGTNVLLGLAPERISDVPGLIAQARMQEAEVPPGWDGAAAERLVDVLLETDFGSIPEVSAGGMPHAGSAHE